MSEVTPYSLTIQWMDQEQSIWEGTEVTVESESIIGALKYEIQMRAGRMHHYHYKGQVHTEEDASGNPGAISRSQSSENDDEALDTEHWALEPSGINTEMEKWKTLAKDCDVTNYTASDLSSLIPFQFRVRAWIAGYGWSNFSPASEFTQTQRRM